MFENFKKHPVLSDNLLWLAWAVGFGFCFPTYNAPALVWFIFVPVLVYAYRQPEKKTVRYAFLYSLVFWLMTTYWLVAFPRSGSAVRIAGVLGLYRVPVPDDRILREAR
jgi:hypothetical protein